MSKVHYTGKHFPDGFGVRAGSVRARVQPYTDGSPRPVVLFDKAGKEVSNIPDDVAEQIVAINPALFVIDGPTKTTPKSKGE